MKFLIISNDVNTLIGFRYPLIRAILNKGIELHLAAPNMFENTEVFNSLEKSGAVIHDINLQRVGTNPISDTKTLLSLTRLMRQIRPDYTLGYTIKPVIYGGLAAWITRVPNRYALINGLGIAFMDEKSDNRSLLMRLIAERLYKLTLPKYKGVFFQNPDDRELFLREKLLPKTIDIFVANGSGVELDKYEYKPPNINHSPRFLLIARLLKSKGVLQFVEAAELIKSKHPEVQFDLVGSLDTNPDAILKEDLDHWIDSGIINYLGKLNDVRPAIIDSSVFVLPSYYREGTPRSILEAMSIGRAIITTTTPGCKETVEPDFNGFLIPPKDTTALVNHLYRFINNPELISTMGKASRQLAEEKYDVNKVNKFMFESMNII